MANTLAKGMFIFPTALKKKTLENHRNQLAAVVHSKTHIAFPLF